MRESAVTGSIDGSIAQLLKKSREVRKQAAAHNDANLRARSSRGTGGPRGSAHAATVARESKPAAR
jgi:hypothetical protein